MFAAAIAGTVNAPQSIVSLGCEGTDELAQLEKWLRPAMPLVALSGCQEFHSSITEVIGKRLMVMQVDPGHRFPAKKPKRNYENYEPDGILKMNWIEKRTHVLPAVVVRLIEWQEDWGGRSPELFEKMLADCVSRFKSDSNRRDVKLVVCVLSTSWRPDQGEKYYKGARKAGLDAKMLLLMPTGAPGEWRNACRKLETLLVEVATAYYRTEGKKVKGNKQSVKRHTQQRLVVRHNFKIAYYAEVCRDTNTQLKYYNSAYQYLKQVMYDPNGLHASEMRAVGNIIVMYDPNGLRALEMRAVGNIIVHKLCRLFLQLGRTTEAVDAFGKYQSAFRIARGPFHLRFLYFAFLANSYLAFGHLLETAPQAPGLRNRRLHGIHSTPPPDGGWLRGHVSDGSVVTCQMVPWSHVRWLHGHMSDGSMVTCQMASWSHVRWLHSHMSDGFMVTCQMVPWSHVRWLRGHMSDGFIVACQMDSWSHISFASWPRCFMLRDHISHGSMLHVHMPVGSMVTSHMSPMAT
eukprot:g63196.t1